MIDSETRQEELVRLYAARGGDAYALLTQRELAARVGKRPHCDKCDVRPFVASLREPNGPEGYEVLDYCAGHLKRCGDCASKPAPTFKWIADIPFEKFKQWTFDHPEAYALKDLRALLPAAPERGGLEFL